METTLHRQLKAHYAPAGALLEHRIGRYRIEVAEGYAPEWQPWPIPKPRDGLKVRLTSL